MICNTSPPTIIEQSFRVLVYFQMYEKYETNLLKVQL